MCLVFGACKSICRIGGQSNKSLLGVPSWRGVYPIADIRHAPFSIGLFGSQRRRGPIDVLMPYFKKTSLGHQSYRWKIASEQKLSSKTAHARHCHDVRCEWRCCNPLVPQWPGVLFNKTDILRLFSFNLIFDPPLEDQHQDFPDLERSMHT